MDSVNSTTFIKRPPCMTDAQEKFLYTKELLSGRIFLASYDETRYVPVLQEYRDVVILNTEETELSHDLDKIRKKWLGVRDVQWIGITGPEDFGFPKAHCLWVKHKNLSFGQYWFQIKHVKLVNQEIVFQLRCIRKYQAPVSRVTSENEVEESSDTKEGPALMSDNKASAFSTEIDIRKILSSFQQSCIKAINTVETFVTWRNFIACLKVGCALLIGLVMMTIQIITHLGEFVLKLVRELSILVNAFTPILIQIIDAFTKIIGGLFILIAAMFRRGGPTNYIQYSRNVHSSQTPVRLTPIDWRERNRNLRKELFSSSEIFK